MKRPWMESVAPDDNTIRESMHFTTFGAVLLLLVLSYFFFRYAMIFLTIADLNVGWLKPYRWFPGKGKRLKTLIHFIIAFGLLILYPAVAVNFRVFVSVAP